ncbi:unnamed product [Ostreococcus tauri]|uniref:Unnamed product n=1 Tax=Ostreococcus tauri TaxID=70448 RepID=A0A090M444_OSTTA|nr:unnamed product [Ostreococcus tauri]CEF98971.1 unnamed product [Ostreococcus tauri]|eukprot:XP_022839572.1 unnamed product [Ostreococcus tauri]
MFALASSAAAVRVTVPVNSKRSVVARAGFKDSVAGKSNWNSYEGADEKLLSPEELKAKNAEEEKKIQARRAEAAKKMEAERKAAGM